MSGFRESDSDVNMAGSPRPSDQAVPEAPLGAPPAVSASLSQARHLLATESDEADLLAECCVKFAVMKCQDDHSLDCEPLQAWLRHSESARESLARESLGTDPRNVPDRFEQAAEAAAAGAAAAAAAAGGADSSIQAEAQRRQERAAGGLRALVLDSIASGEALHALPRGARCREAARDFHAAAIYLEVLSMLSGEDGLPAELQSSRKYVQWRTHVLSHLVENCIHEHHDEDTVDLHYEVHQDKVLGRGTYGVVTQATQKRTGDVFACKVLALRRASNGDAKKLWKEINVMRGLDHPHVIRLHEVFFGKRHIYLIMDLCEGGEVFSVLTDQPEDRFPEATVRTLGRQIVSGVRYLHDKGITHRDLKLENFLFESRDLSGERLSVKMVDFGLADHFSAHQSPMTNTVGTTFYVAPEVLNGTYTEQCDLWSTGVMIYMMLSGAPPFYGDSDEQTKTRIRAGVVRFPESHFAHVSEEAKDLVRKLLVVDPARRLTAAQALCHPFLTTGRAAAVLDAITASPTPGDAPDERLPSTRPRRVTQHEELLRGLRTFQKASTFRKVVLEIVAYNLPASKIEELRTVFEKVDVDASGSISARELQHALHLSGGDVTQLLEAVDLDGNHELNYNEFIAAAISTRLDIDDDHMHSIFEQLDSTNSGFLTKDALRQAVGCDVDEAQLEQMMEDAGTSQDGKIYYDDFARSLRAWNEARSSCSGSRTTSNESHSSGVPSLSSGGSL